MMHMCPAGYPACEDPFPAGLRGRLVSGEFRRDQNWIGPEHAPPIERATFVPPPVPDMHTALDGFERFLHEEQELPVS